MKKAAIVGVVAEDVVPVVLFPLCIPSVKTAIDDAIEKDGCAVEPA